jgi:hypothetical protein
MSNTFPAEEIDEKVDVGQFFLDLFCCLLYRVFAGFQVVFSDGSSTTLQKNVS